MAMTTATDVSTIPPIGHDEAMTMLATELNRTLELLRSLDEHDWAAETDCPAWDVRRMYLHVLGACEAGASIKENVHQMRKGRAYRKRNGGPLEAALSAVQVDERLALSPEQLVDRLIAVAPRTVEQRRKLPAVLRRMRLSVDGPVVEKWSLGYLIDIIYLRDAWMHRVDAARATGKPMTLTSEHDGRIVADVVAEWARRHGKPFELVLTGPAGGAFRASGPAAETIELDAVEFCRTLAGRRPGDGLLQTIVPF